MMVKKIGPKLPFGNPPKLNLKGKSYEKFGKSLLLRLKMRNERGNK